MVVTKVVTPSKGTKSETLAQGFRFVDRCDVCGERLTASEAMSGLCQKHQPRRRR